MEKHLLSKSTFIRGAQCLKSLYLYKKRYFLRDRLSDEQRLKFKRGFNVGIFAQRLYPGGIDVRPGSPSAYKKSVEKTVKLLEEKTKVIYEAGFQHNRVLVFLDVLINENNSCKAIEVKSSRSISPTYMLDAALQYYVIKGSGLNLEDFSIVHIDENYIMNKELDINKLFTSVSVMQEIAGMQEKVTEMIKLEKEILNYKHSPKIDIGPHCYNPYPCDFIGHCWKNVPRPSVFEVHGLSFDEKHELYKNKITGPGEVKEKFVNNELIENSCKAIMDKKTHFDRQAIQQTISQLQTPSAFLYLLVQRPAIPYISGTRPYQQIVYGYFLLENKVESTNEPIFKILNEPEKYQAFIKTMIDFLKNFKTLIIYDDVPSNLLSLKNEIKFISLKDLFINGHIIDPDIQEHSSFQSVAKKLIKPVTDKTSSVLNDLLAADIFESFNDNHDAELLKQVEQYGNYTAKDMKKFWEWLKAHSN